MSQRGRTPAYPFAGCGGGIPLVYATPSCQAMWHPVPPTWIQGRSGDTAIPSEEERIQMDRLCPSGSSQGVPMQVRPHRNALGEYGAEQPGGAVSQPRHAPRPRIRNSSMPPSSAAQGVRLPGVTAAPQSPSSSAASTIRSQRSRAAEVLQVHKADLKIGKRIGGGSFGDVYLGTLNGEMVAIKVVKSTDGSSEDDTHPSPLQQKLEEEAGVMAPLLHPNVVRLIAVCLDPPCLVTKYCERGSLHDVLRRALGNSGLAGQLTWTRRLGMALDAAEGMRYLHTRDPPVIHRDLKSPNLLVDEHWRVKVADFNLSRVLEDGAVLSSLMGPNPRWLAPEVLTPREGTAPARRFTRASDVYAFGMMLWELQTWRLPWHDLDSTDVYSLYYRIPHEGLRPEIPPEHECPTPDFPGMAQYVALMQRCWAQDPAERPSFAEVIPVLRGLLGAEQARAGAQAQ